MRLAQKVEILKERVDKLVNIDYRTHRGFTWKDILNNLKDILFEYREEQVESITILPGAFKIIVWREWVIKEHEDKWVRRIKKKVCKKCRRVRKGG